MVKELEINDWEPCEIADMIEGEISALVPEWKTKPYHTFNYQDDEDDPHHPFNTFSSCSSSQASGTGLITSHKIDKMENDWNWLQGMAY